jgi:isopenicillin-N epimerase
MTRDYEHVKLKQMKTSTLKDLFLLDPTVIFLNHGSFGATPRPVFEVYQEWQRRLERQPVRFFAYELPEHLATARQALGQYLNTDASNLVYIPNATFGVNIVARSLNLKAGDEVVTTNLEYGACDNAWTYLSQRQGFHYKKATLTLPVKSREALVDEFWQSVSEKTKVIYLSHITSGTALTLPVEMICKKAKEAGILTVIDGAHVPGQLPLDLTILEADFYTGNCHKWLCGPKGSAFLYARPEKQRLIEPLVVGWGWGEDRVTRYGSDFLDYHQWLGTNDLSAYLSVPAAIEFQKEHDWTNVRASCHALLNETLQHLQQYTGLINIYPDDSYYQQMAIAPLPKTDDLTRLKNQLYDDYGIEIPLTEHAGQQYVRISLQGYNTRADTTQLSGALTSLLARG